MSRRGIAELARILLGSDQHLMLPAVPFARRVMNQKRGPKGQVMDGVHTDSIPAP
jgi:hypothetical protein